MLAASFTRAQTAPEVAVTRLQCGTNAAPTDVGLRFSDTYAFNGLKVQLTFSCYLIKHGDDYLIWDAGNPVGTAPTAPKTSLVDLLGQLKLTPAQVKYVGISHYHGDRTDKRAGFRKRRSSSARATGMSSPIRNPRRCRPFANWTSGGGKVEPVVGDKDIFGDGTVVMLNARLRRPSWLVRLKQMGNVLITGDLALARITVMACRPSTPIAPRRSRRSIASRRSRRTESDVIIQHDERDVGSGVSGSREVRQRQRPTPPRRHSLPLEHHAQPRGHRGAVRWRQRVLVPKVIGRVNDQYVKVAKLNGEFVWHAHDAEDELFPSSRASRIQLEDGEVRSAGHSSWCRVASGTIPWPRRKPGWYSSRR
jgi:glyoxylase-like metal-dependent hydrolase (beta-lactamase superfamily II)